ncbi:unnamed protein product [Heterosigma akashiwo]
MVSEGKYDWGEENEIRSIWQVGNVVERDIDGEWYAAKIVSVIQDEFDEIIYDVEYVDDGNVEHGVPEDELRTGDHETLVVLALLGEPRRWCSGSALPGQHQPGGRGRQLCYEQHYATRCQGRGGGAVLGGRGGRLAGGRGGQRGPGRVAHGSRGAGRGGAAAGRPTAYIINGPENNVATGSGLRGIRWLKEGAR